MLSFIIEVMLPFGLTNLDKYFAIIPSFKLLEERISSWQYSFWMVPKRTYLDFSLTMKSSPIMIFATIHSWSADFFTFKLLWLFFSVAGPFGKQWGWPWVACFYPVSSWSLVHPDENLSTSPVCYLFICNKFCCSVSCDIVIIDSCSVLSVFSIIFQLPSCVNGFGLVLLFRGNDET